MAFSRKEEFYHKLSDAIDFALTNKKEQIYVKVNQYQVRIDPKILALESALHMREWFDIARTADHFLIPLNPLRMVSSTFKTVRIGDPSIKGWELVCCYPIENGEIDKKKFMVNTTYDCGVRLYDPCTLVTYEFEAPRKFPPIDLGRYLSYLR